MKRLTALALPEALLALVAVPAHAQKASSQEQAVLKANQTLDEAALIKKDRATLGLHLENTGIRMFQPGVGCRFS